MKQYLAAIVINHGKFTIADEQKVTVLRLSPLRVLFIMLHFQ